MNKYFTSLIQQTILSQTEENQQQQQYKQQQQQNNVPNNSQKIQINSLNRSQKVVAPIVPTSLAESRRVTIERLRLYNEKQNKLKKRQQPKYQPQQGLHFGPAKVIKPGPHPHLTINPYQKPNADLIKPRITGLKYQVRK